MNEPTKSAQRGGGPGRWAKCADAQGNRCNLPTCRNCERNRKEREAAARRAQFRMKDAQEAQTQTQRDPEPVPMMGISHAEIAEHNERQPATPGLIHTTVRKPVMPSIEGSIGVDMASFGPPEPAPTLTPEEEEHAQEEADADADRAERLANPSATALVASHYWTQAVIWIVDQHAAIGAPLPFHGTPTMEAGIKGLKTVFDRSFALLLPDVEISDNMCHGITAGVPLALLGSLKMAQKRQGAAGALGGDEGDNDREPDEGADTAPSEAPEGQGNEQYDDAEWSDVLSAMGDEA